MDGAISKAGGKKLLDARDAVSACGDGVLPEVLSDFFMAGTGRYHQVLQYTSVISL